MATQFRISDIKPLVTNLAQTSHYQLIFGGLPAQLISYLSQRGVTSFFIAQDAGLLCSSASLPTAFLGTKMVDGNYTGIQEKFATNRTYNDISLEFYVDSNYQSLLFFESWIEFIASGSHNNINGVSNAVGQSKDGYFIRMQYPDYYKANSTKILKFDRNYQREIEYTFYGLFPYDISAPVVSYTSSEILKVTVNFKYDRYVAGRPLSNNYYNGNSTNNQSNQSNTPSYPTATSSAQLVPVSAGAAQAGGVMYIPQGMTYAQATASGQVYSSPYP